MNQTVPETSQQRWERERKSTCLQCKAEGEGRKMMDSHGFMVHWKRGKDTYSEKWYATTVPSLCSRCVKVNPDA